MTEIKDGAIFRFRSLNDDNKVFDDLYEVKGTPKFSRKEHKYQTRDHITLTLVYRGFERVV